MSDRRVTHTGKDKDGDITARCNPGEIWSPRLKEAPFQISQTEFILTT